MKTPPRLPDIRSICVISAFKYPYISLQYPFEKFSDLRKLSIFNAFSKYAVVLSSFEIQAFPICQIEWFNISILNLDED